jgi:hypothetical protein
LEEVTWLYRFNGYRNFPSEALVWAKSVNCAVGRMLLVNVIHIGVGVRLKPCSFMRAIFLFMENGCCSISFRE